MKKSGLISSGVIVIFVILFLGLKNHGSDSLQSQTRFLMDTFCTVKVPGDIEVLKFIEQALNRIEEIDRKFNILNPESPIYDFNNNDMPITDKEIIDLVEVALQVCEKSDGAYDITIYPIIDLWGFFSDSPSVPLKETIDELLHETGYQNLMIVNGALVKINKKVKIDLGSIAKGYAISEALKVLKQAQIESALIDAGGDIYALGKYNDKPWKIGIRNPRGEGVIGSLELSDMAVVTSGDYERFFEKDGVRYHHIIDPRTGYPTNELASVTVISQDMTLADAWSTAIFVLGKERGLKTVEDIKSIQTLLVSTEGEKFYSPDMQVKTKLSKR